MCFISIFSSNKTYKFDITNIIKRNGNNYEKIGSFKNKAEKILNQLAKSFGDIPLNKVINDTTYKSQAITAILFGMMNEDAS